MPETPRIRVIPPLIPIATMSTGAALHLLWPIAIWNSPFVFWAGLVIVSASLVPAIWGVMVLRSAGTTVDVRKHASALVTGGIFRFTRNPMYLSLQMLCVGIALMMNSLIMQVLVVPTGSILCHMVILKEEAALAAQFGSAYSDYATRVRRWI